jgi:competence protein ComEA
MHKQLLQSVFACMMISLAAFGTLYAAVNVNAANEAALEGVKGIGPSKAAAIVKERTAHGPYKNAADLAARVKGLGAKSVARLQQQGLAIGTAAKKTVSAAK